MASAHSTAPSSPAVSKASAGALEGWLASQRFLAAGDFAGLLQGARERGWQVVGAAVHPAAVDVSALGSTLTGGQPTILVLGSEGEGLGQDTLEACDHLVQVSPRCPPGDALFSLDSLNVSAAGAVLMQGAATAVR